MSSTTEPTLGDIVSDTAALDGVPLPVEPQPVRVIEIDPETKEFRADHAALAAILRRPDVADLPVVVVSVAGPFRKGKSFLLNYFLRYLSQPEDAAEDWLGDVEAPLAGFKWRHGSRRETTGLWMWNTPFVRTLPSGEKAAVVLVDTQGTFDNKTTMHENATIFALNSVLSSFQVYNISHLISEDVLSSMSLFTKLGTWIFDNQRDQKNRVTPFQTLQFLVRDWPYPDEYKYGEGPDGGAGYLATVLEVEADGGNGKHEELRAVRRDLAHCFNRVGCHLLPHPGQRVAESADFSGKIADMRPEFVAALRDFVPRVLGRAALVPKTFLGQPVTCSDLQAYIESLVRVLHGDAVPLIKNSADSFCETQWDTQRALMAKQYRMQLRAVTKSGRPYMDPAALDKVHLDAHAAALRGYTEANLTYSEAHFVKFRDALEHEIAAEFELASEENRNKALGSTLRTPLTLGGGAFALHVGATVLSFTGPASFAALLSFVTWLAMLTLLFWVYCQHSGQYTDVAVQIDDAAQVVFERSKRAAFEYYFGVAPAEPVKPKKD